MFLMPKSKNKKKDFCGFEPAKVHCEFPGVTNVFQMIFDELSNSKGNKGDRIKLSYYLTT